MTTERIIFVSRGIPVINYHENPYSENRFVALGGTDGLTERQSYMMKLTAAFRKPANAIYCGAFVTEMLKLDLHVEQTQWKREMQETTAICYAV